MCSTAPRIKHHFFDKKKMLAKRAQPGAASEPNKRLRSSSRIRHAQLVAGVTDASTGAAATSLRLHSSSPFFVAWNGVLVLTFAGFPPSLAGVKARLNRDAAELGLRAEQFGSKWPKVTLASLSDTAPPLTLTQLEQLREVCRAHAASTHTPPMCVPVHTLSVVQYARRSLEKPSRREDIRLHAADSDGSSMPDASEIQRVDGVVSEWANLEAYHPRVAAPGSRASSYRHASSAGHTCVTFLNAGEDLTTAVRAFQRAVDSLLPGHYVWFDESAWHCTLRALD